jgi:anhydro-N-acetylmuramic acid kinase
MNPQIAKLYHTAQKSERLIVGLMSGTSLDGLDVALCKFSGAGASTKVELLQFDTVTYDDYFKSAIREVFAKSQVSLPHLCRLNPWIAQKHAEIINALLKNWGFKNEQIDVIASHGQTVMHSPKRLHKLANYPNATLQIGDGDHLAIDTGILTISDFRQKHCAVGGEGAPLALYGDYLLFSSSLENRVLINIGGISNFTFLPANNDFNAVFATDTGPGNTIIDAFVQKHFGIPYDKDAGIASKGKLHSELLDRLCNEAYFEENVPKTTGPELFNLDYLKRAIGHLEVSKEDTLHTLCHFTAKTLCNEILRSVPKQFVNRLGIYLSGGGMHNPLICQLIMQQLSHTDIQKMDVLGISGDAKEAVLFAALANETIAGDYGFISPKSSTSSFFMGKISFSL